jgi:hypothetical protein
MCLENQSEDMRTIMIRKDQIEPDKPRIKNTIIGNHPPKNG